MKRLLVAVAVLSASVGGTAAIELSQRSLPVKAEAANLLSLGMASDAWATVWSVHPSETAALPKKQPDAQTKVFSASDSRSTQVTSQKREAKVAHALTQSAGVLQ